MPKIHRDRPPTNVANQVSFTVSGFVGSEAQLAAEIDRSLARRKVPPRSANKAKWVAYAKALGVDASGTKGQIIERVTGG
jgi:hypothetical protein